MSQSIDDCLECHDDDTMTMVKNGKEISLNINPQAYENSPHHEITCIQCHVGFDPEEEPHRENIEPVDCTPCHEKSEKSFKQSKHASEFSCTECHGNVHAPQEKNALLRDCENCHEDAFRDYTESIHFGNKKGPRCYDCHTVHSFKIPGSDNCLSCHGKKEFVHTNILHKDLRFVLDYKESIHGKLIECSDCHSGHKILPGESPQSNVNIRNIPKTCSKCHKKEAEQYRNSEHGEAFASGFEDAPTCTGCHGEHDIHQITDSRSSVSREHEIEVCLRCHLDSPEVRSKMTHTGSFIADYQKSIHGRKVKEGNLNAAVCSDCHGGHEEMKASNPRSKVNKFNISKTCGQCHEQEAADFSGSIHAEALSSGVEEAPTCTDCHGEHEILEPSSPESPVAPQNVSKEVCGPCHNSVKLTEKYGLSSERFSSYNDSFHGLAVRFGDVEAANCASCHGVHKILPSTDPRSSINKNNLVKTCGKCHPGANKNFTRGKVHVTKEAGGDKIIFIITSIYLALILGTIGAMALHNFLDWFRKLKEQYRQRYEETGIIYPLREKRRLYIRMTLSERIQHFLLLTSFFTLVFTGFMLKFPDAWWVMIFRDILGGAIFELRGLVHRVAAVVMVGDSLFHLYYIIFTKRGREFIRDILFRPQDIKDMVQVLRYNLGISKNRPRFGRFSYIEKAEYWALIWGTVVMTITGVALWFENQFLGWFSKLFLDICTTIHYYEAWLAFLSILVWHIYFVIFNPDVYPMNFAWITGKITEEEMEHEHPLELERLKAEEAGEEKEML